MWVLTKQIDKVEVIWMLILYGRLCKSKLKSKKIGGLKIKDTQEKSIVIKNKLFQIDQTPIEESKCFHVLFKLHFYKNIFLSILRRHALLAACRACRGPDT